LFAESTGRFLIEVAAEREADLVANLEGSVMARIGRTLADGRLRVRGRAGHLILDVPVEDLVTAWKRPLDLDGTLAEGRQ
jgi:hypothetical protein